MYDLAKIVWIGSYEFLRISHLIKYVRIAMSSSWFFTMWEHDVWHKSGMACLLEIATVTKGACLCEGSLSVSRLQITLAFFRNKSNHWKFLQTLLLLKQSAILHKIHHTSLLKYHLSFTAFYTLNFFATFKYLCIMSLFKDVKTSEMTAVIYF